MTGLFTKNSHTILPGQILAGIAHESKTLHIAGGLAWITIEGMPDDHWLDNGDELSIPSDRLIVIEAGKCPSRIDIRSAHTGHSKQSGKSQLILNDANTSGCPTVPMLSPETSCGTCT